MPDIKKFQATNRGAALPKIRRSEHPTALVDSLGPLPFPGGQVAPHYFELLYDRAASLALALAASAGLDAPEDEDDDEAGSLDEHA